MVADNFLTDLSSSVNTTKQKLIQLQVTNNITRMSSAVKYFYKGQETDLIVFVSSVEEVDEYLKDPSIGKLSQVVELFKVFTNNVGEGAEGELGEASKSQLANEFGKGKKIEEIIEIILKEGEPNAKVEAISSKGQYRPN